MEKLKRVTWGLVISLAMIIAAGCTNSKSGAEVDAKENKYIIKYAHNQQDNSPQDQGAKLFKEKVEELSNGKIEVQIFPSNQLGEMRELVEQTQNGQIEMTQQSLSLLSNFAPTLTFNDLPFLYPTEDIMWKALDSKTGDIYNEALDEVGLLGLGYMSGGPKQFSANKPLRTLEDFKGLTMRALPAPIIIDTMSALGSNPTPIEFSELYNSLQQKVVDGQENPLETIVNFKLYEVQDYVALTNHAWMVYSNVMNKDFFNSLPEDLQDNIIEAMSYANQEQRKIMQKNEQQLRVEVEDAGVEVIDFTQDDLEPFKKATKKVHDKYAKELGEDTLDEIKRNISEVAK